MGSTLSGKWVLAGRGVAQTLVVPCCYTLPHRHLASGAASYFGYPKGTSRAGSLYGVRGWGVLPGKRVKKDDSLN